MHCGNAAISAAEQQALLCLTWAQSRTVGSSSGARLKCNTTAARCCGRYICEGGAIICEGGAII